MELPSNVYLAPLCSTAAVDNIRHTWILKRRKRPIAPRFGGCPTPRHGPNTNERNAQIVLTYFHPWTLQEHSSDTDVPFAGKLRADFPSWQDALTWWLDGHILCEESKRYVSRSVLCALSRLFVVMKEYH